MSNFWNILGIPPTRDTAQIKSAYARQSKTCNPEDDPQGFMRLRKAYQAAIAYAQGSETEPVVFLTEKQSSEHERYSETFDDTQKNESGSAGFSSQEKLTGKEEVERKKEEQQGSQEVIFTFSDAADQADSYRESAAFQRFSKIYQKSNMKNWKLWMEYFVSPEFLELRSQEGFCSLMMEHILGQMDSVRPGASFLKILHVAYCVQLVTRDALGQPVCQSISCRQPPAAILQLIRLLPDCSHFSGEDQVMLYSFSDYDQLVTLYENGWDYESLSVLEKILNGHILRYIKDRIPAPSFANPNAADDARHPLSLQLLTHFFSFFALPREVYQVAWDVLDLKSAKLGRAAVLYGALREVCLTKCPFLEGYAPQKFTELKNIFKRYTQTPQADSKIIEIFDREEIASALLNQEFVEHNVLSRWITSGMPSEFLEQLYSFYLEHPQAPFASRVRQACKQTLKEQQEIIRNKEDEQDDARTAPRSLNHRPFLRYWMRVAFPRFRRFHNLLRDCLPLLPDWRKQLFSASEQEGDSVQPIIVQWEDISIRVLLHQFYLEYRYGEEELVVPCFPFQDILSLGEVGLWLLPLAVVQVGKEQLVERSIVSMLENTAFPSENLTEAASALTEGLYQWNLENDVQSVLVFQETGLELHGAEIAIAHSGKSGNDELSIQLFHLRDGSGRPRYLPDYFGPFAQWDNALSEAHKLLDQQVIKPPLCYAPKGEHHRRRLPDCVYYKPLKSAEKCWRPPSELLDRIWGTLDFWDKFRRTAKDAEERVDIIRQSWSSWRQTGGHRESLISQMGILCSFLTEQELPPQLSPECLADPNGPLAILDQLQIFLLHMDQTEETQRLQALLDFAGWSEGTYQEELPAFQPFFAGSDSVKDKNGEIFQGSVDQKMHKTLQERHAYQKEILDEREQNKTTEQLWAIASLEQLRTAFLQRIEPLLDWLLIRVDILGDCYLKELDQFLLALSNGNLKRLELVIQPKAWELPDREEAYPPVYSLVFQWGEQGISCLYFDDLHNIFYALRQDDKRPRTNAECLVNISQDKPLPFCCQFASFFPLQCRLQEILDVLRIHTWQGVVPSEAGEFLWTEAWGGVHIGSQRSKYNLAKQDLGGFPLERAMIPKDQDISLPVFISADYGVQKSPSFLLTLWGVDGNRESEIRIEKNERVSFTKAVKRYFDGDISRLRLSWEVNPINYEELFAPDFYQRHLDELENQKAFCHIILKREGPKMMMLVLEDFTARASYYVADKETYMDTERKYPKESFAGKTVPAYLIHIDPARLRNQLVLLLDHLLCPYSVTTRFAEYAGEKPVRARAYKDIRAEELGM